MLAAFQVRKRSQHFKRCVYFNFSTSHYQLHILLPSAHRSFVLKSSTMPRRSLFCRSSLRFYSIKHPLFIHSLDVLHGSTCTCFCAYACVFAVVVSVLCLYLCLCVLMCACMCLRVLVYASVCLFVPMCACFCLGVLGYAYVCLFMLVYAYVCLCVLMRPYAHLCSSTMFFSKHFAMALAS